ncbi:unnamed protein product, partial [Discosporangium mesarthrocarpum]
MGVPGPVGGGRRGASLSRAQPELLPVDRGMWSGRSRRDNSAVLIPRSDFLTMSAAPPMHKPLAERGGGGTFPPPVWQGGGEEAVKTREALQNVRAVAAAVTHPANTAGFHSISATIQGSVHLPLSPPVHSTFDTSFSSADLGGGMSVKAWAEKLKAAAAQTEGGIAVAHTDQSSHH